MVQEETLEYHVRKAIEHALKGSIVVTLHQMYGGLGGYVPMCSIYSKEGVELLRKIKKRPKNMPFTALVTSIGMANCIGIVNEVARDLLERYANAPLSIVIENRSTPSWVTGGGDTVSVNIAIHEVQRKMIDFIGPMVFTSPNVHGQEVVVDFKSIRKVLGHEDEIYYIPYELLQEDLKQVKSEREGVSTIVDTVTKPPKIIRQGAINVDI